MSITEQSGEEARRRAALARARSIAGAAVGGVLVLTALLAAGLATAAEIIDVRLGRHADYTRVVFELDASAGFRIFHDPSDPKATEIVVSLDATSIPRTESISKALVSKVEIEPKGGKSIARIRLTRGGLRVKQMMLRNPARIVLDVMNDRTAAAEPKPAPKPAPKPVAPPPKPVAKPTPTPAPTPVAKPPPPPPPTPVAQAVPPAPEPPAPEPPAFMDRETSPAPAEPEPAAAADDLDDEDEYADEADDEDELAEAPAPPPPPPARAPQPMVARKTDEGMDATLIAMMAGGALVVLGAIFVFLRRRGGQEFTFDEDDEDTATVGGADDANPFAAAMGSSQGRGAEQLPLAGAEEPTTQPSFLGDDDDLDSAETMISAPGGAPGEKGEGMDLSGDETMISSSANVPPMMAGGSGDVTRMMREFERRIAALESRLDEVTDAKERLERQVAAQTEELRVQRAAIARTQRAVRNLSRPEGEEATEPALRDPDKPRSGG